MKVLNQLKFTKRFIFYMLSLLAAVFCILYTILNTATIPNWTAFLCVGIGIPSSSLGTVYLISKWIVNPYLRQLQQSTIEQKQRQVEMDTARRIQQRFLPRQFKLPPSVDLAVELQQSREVGGDLYDFFLLDNHLYFSIGDVSGKGTPAALYMISLIKLFHYVAESHTSPAAICKILNEQMCRDADDDMYATIFLGIIDLHTGILTYTNAGHPSPLLISPHAKVGFIRQYPDVPVGILEGHEYSEHSYRIEPGNALLFYTDGVTDAEDIQGQFFTHDKLVQHLEEKKHLPPKAIVSFILEKIKQHSRNRQLSDDLTMLLIKYQGDTSAPQ